MIAYGITDNGKVRDHNEEAYRFSLETDGSAVAVLCDGMGGVQAGEVASSIAADAFLEYAQRSLRQSLPPLTADIARESAAYANLQVYDRSYREESLHGMGTTLVAAVIRPDEASVVNVGDSRCYWLAEGEIQQVTRDHS